MLKAIAIAILVATTTTACGFHLKGSNSTQNVQVLNYPQLRLEIPKAYQALQSPLEKYLIASGIQMHTEQDKVLKIVDYQFRRQQLNGKLTEVLLNLSVTFRIEDQNGKVLTQERTVRNYRNYQYDVETVNTENQQEQYLTKIMLDDIAQQISQQITNNRLATVP